MKIQLDISPKRIADLFVCAIEGGSLYWAQSFHGDKATIAKTTESPWYFDAKVYEGEFAIKVAFDDPAKDEGNGRGRKTIGPTDIKAGLEIMATKYGHQFGEFMRDNEDAEVADVFLQCVVLGDVVYVRGWW